MGKTKKIKEPAASRHQPERPHTKVKTLDQTTPLFFKNQLCF